MTHDMSGVQWFLYFLANWGTAVAYTVIPVRLWLNKGVIMTRPNTFLFSSFVLLCGLHHWLHPPAMFFGWWGPLIAGDIAMLGVSLVAMLSLQVATGKVGADG